MSCHSFADDRNGDFLSLQSRIKEINESSSSSVVRVKATREETKDGKVRRLLKMGSGFFVSKDGHVLTTGLLEDADRIWIEHDQSFYLAEKIGRDPLCNISLLKIIELPPEFTFVSLSDSPAEIETGSFLIGLTCALEFNVGPTIGLLQSEEFAFGKRLFPTKMFRTSLALGPGEVGAPVFDLQGKFIGIAHAALPDLKSSFLLPASACSRIREDLMFSGQVEYGWFGITTTRKLNSTSGFDIVIQSLINGSPASNSKLVPGDVIKKIGKRVVTEQGDLAFAAFFSRPGTYAEFQVIRSSKELKIPVKVAARPLSLENDSKEIAEADGSMLEDFNNSRPKIGKRTDSNKSQRF